jgi:hypothetical protein
MGIEKVMALCLGSHDSWSESALVYIMQYVYTETYHLVAITLGTAWMIIV